MESKRMFEVFSKTGGGTVSLGKTFARSEKQAINNVFFRRFGKYARNPQTSFYAVEVL